MEQQPITLYFVYEWAGNMLGPYLSRELADAVYEKVTKGGTQRGWMTKKVIDPASEAVELDRPGGPRALIGGGEIVRDQRHVR